MNQTFQHEVSAAVDSVAESKQPRIAVVAASWHREIVSSCTRAIQAELERSRLPKDHTDYFEVPGAFEIPLHARRLAKSGRYDAIIACGLVVNGGIYRHEFVAATVIDGLMQVQLETDTPVFSAVLTPRDFHDNEEHRSFFKDHFVKKGTEVARACLDTIESLATLPSGDA